MKKKRIKKRFIILGSLTFTFVLAIVLFCSITGFNIKTFIFGAKATGTKVVSETDLETLVLETPTDGSTPDDYDALTNFAYFAYKLEHSDFEATTEGKAHANYNGIETDQSVYDYRLKSNDYYLMDTRSTSKFVKIYQEQFFTPNKVLYRMGSSSDYDKMTVKARSNKQEFLLYGFGPDKTIGYIVCQDTLKSDSGVVKNDDGTYTTTYVLDSTVAPVYYQRKVKTNASISDMPNFVSVSLTYTYDSNWNIKEATYNEVYSIYKMKSWIETSTDITETFTYLSSDEALSKISSKYNFYKNYFDLEVPDDDEVSETQDYEMTALDYLGTMAGLINKDYIYAKTSLNINDKYYDLDLAINLKDMEVEINYDNNAFLYKDNKLYINGNKNGYYDLNELPLDTQNTTSLDLNKLPLNININDLISTIMANIGEGVVTHNGEYTNVSITFDILGYKIPTVFKFYTPNDDTIEFKTLEAEYTYCGDDFKLTFELLDELESKFITLPDNKLVFAYDLDVNTTIEYKNKTFGVSGNIYLDILNMQAQGSITLTYNDLSINCDVIYKDNYIYICALDNIFIKMSQDELLSYANVDAKNSNVSISYSDIKTYLSYINFNITNSMNVLYNQETSIGDIIISPISVNVTPLYEYKDINVWNKEYHSLDDITGLIDIALDYADIIKTNSFSIKLNDIDLNMSGIRLLINGNVYYNNKNINADLKLKINDEYDLNLNVKLIDSYAYITVSNQTFKLDIRNIDSFLNEVLTKINSTFNKNLTFDNNGFELSTVIDTIKTLDFTSNTVSIDLYNLLTNEMNLCLVLNNNQIEFNTTGYINSNGSIILEAEDIKNIEVSSSNTLDENSLLQLLDYISASYKLVQDKLFNVSINELIIEKNKTSDYFVISGTIKLKLIDSINDFSAQANIIIEEFRNNKSYGWHQININIISAVENEGTSMIYASYGNNRNDLSNVVKVYSTYNGILDLISSIKNLMKIDTFNNLLDDGSATLIINELIKSLNVTDTELSLEISQNALNKYITDESIINLVFTKLNNKLASVELSNAYISYSNKNNYLKINNLDISIFDIDELLVEVPTNLSGYIDLKNISYLTEALYNDATKHDFEISGTVTLQALEVINIKVPIDIKIYVDENGKPEIMATLEIPDVTAVVVRLLTKKTLTIYYKDGFVYLNRVDHESESLFGSKKKNTLLKISYQEFSRDILNYLMGEYGMGMPDTIMNLITGSEANGDGFVDASECVNSATIGTDSFAFNLNLGEIVDNSSIGDMDVVLSTSEISNDGVVEKVLTTISKFELTMVNVIKLKGSGLTLSNVSNNKWNTIDISSLYSFVDSFNSKYNTDTYYSGNNGNYSESGTITHTLTYNYDGYTTSTTYYYLDNITLPTSVTIDSVVHDVVAWYSDSTYQHIIDTYTMPAYNKTLYAKIN